MAAIQDLLQQITDDSLRERLRQEFEAIMKKKSFGLVWEDHILESTLLPEEPVSVNSMVARKKGETKRLYRVKSVADGIARCAMCFLYWFCFFIVFLLLIAQIHE